MTFDDLADRNDAIWKLHDEGKSAAEIATILGIEPTKNSTGEQIVRRVTGEDDGFGD